jgi:DNA-directed RNA polymerase subunit RPC12/RpoP
MAQSKKDYQSAYYRKHRDKLLHQAKLYVKERPDQTKRNQQRWKEKHREEAIIYQREYRKRFPEKHREEVRRYAREHKRSPAVRYGLNPQQYELMIQEQNGLCAICGKPNTVGGKLFIDHNHITKKVRGLLCHHCNSALGYLFADNFGIELLCSAISYLRNTDNKEISDSV